MDKSREEKYYQLFERMIDEMTNPENFSRERFIGILTEVSLFFRLSKGVTEFYKTISKFFCSIHKLDSAVVKIACTVAKI